MVSIKKRGDYYIVSGGRWADVRTMSKAEANTVASARKRLEKKDKQKK